MVKFDCSGPATNHLQNLIDAVGINLFTVWEKASDYEWTSLMEETKGGSFT